MAILENEVKAFVVQAMACFDIASKMAQTIRLEFGIEFSRNSENIIGEAELTQMLT
ncbi:DUF2280 domain-containing protein [Pseudomonas paralactis]|uniref:DUF2280 domain-containing protein n=1 Tax=Pseudomonas paralactis TaxID=1615673 RepID=A0ABS0V0Y1_9PSED|nr:DUF2280 domain-containing protein [Pseudomonas paralactis]MBI6633956.1 DUF2280 domain-containing protein [Pseudomonas paralactis]